MKKNHYPESVYKSAEKTIERIGKYQWKYRNIFFLGLSIVAAVYLSQSGVVLSAIENLGAIGYPAAFLLGALFTSAFTALPSTVAIFGLGQTHNPIVLAVVGAAGSVAGNYFLFKFTRDRLAREIVMLSKEVKNLTKPVSFLFFWEEARMRIWHAISKSRIWHVLVPLLAGFIMASPLPDEVAVAIFGAVRFDAERFVIISYVLHFIGILAIAYSARIL